MIEQLGIDPRGDLSQVEPEVVESHVHMLAYILTADLDEFEIADDLRAYVKAYLIEQPELYMCVLDKLVADKTTTKAIWRKWLETYRD
jgi:hypothetical protein